MPPTQRVGKSRNYTIYLIVSTLLIILVFSDTKWMFDMRQKGGWMGLMSGNNDDDMIGGQLSTDEHDSSSYHNDEKVLSFLEAVNMPSNAFWGNVDLTTPAYELPDYCQNLSHSEHISLVSIHSYSNSKQAVEDFKSVLDASLDSLYLHFPDVYTKVFCGSTTCMLAVESYLNNHSSYIHDKRHNGLYIKRPCLSSTRIVLPDMAEETPVEMWMKEHALNKILSNHYYEHQLQVVSQLLVSYHHGGLVLPVGGIVDKIPTHQMGDWISVASSLHSMRSNENTTKFVNYSNYDNNTTTCEYLDESLADNFSGEKEMNGSFYFALKMTAHSTATVGMLARFSAIYPTQKTFQRHMWPISIDWKKYMLPQCNRLVSHVFWMDERLSKRVVKSNFGTFSYDTRRIYLKSINNPGMNVGDEIQGIMGVQFLPYVNSFVERDNLTIVKRLRTSSEAPTTLFMNAWYGNSMKVWPPPPSIDPVLVSIHTENIQYSQEQFGGNDSVNYLKRHAPVGGRDSTTTNLFKNKGILAFLSGCMTMTFKLNIKRQENYLNGSIYVVDVPQETLAKFLPKFILEKAVFLSHKALDKAIVDDEVMRYSTAYSMLSKYAKARLVITSRLHVAMPSVALGTPVIFIYDINLPGGWGATGKARIKTLTPFTTLVDETNYKSFDWTKLPTMNPQRDLFMKLKRSLFIMAFSHNSMISDASIKFGMVPPTLYRSDEIPCVDNKGTRTIDKYGRSVIHLSFAIDDTLFYNYDGSAFATFLKSLATSNEGNTFVIYILTDGLQQEQRCQLGVLTQIYLHTMKVYVMDMAEMLNTRAGQYGLPDMANGTHHVMHHQHVTRITMARLLLPELLPCVDKIIWLDLDATVMSSLAGLWNIDVSKTECGIAGRESVTAGYVKSFGNMQEVRNDLGFDGKLSGEGFNAGVLVIDMQRLRRSFSAKKKFKNFKYLSDYLTQGGRNDQVILNVWCNGKFKRLDPAWNVFFVSGTFFDPMHLQPLSKFKIFHWTGHIKMWNIAVRTEDDVRKMGVRNARQFFPKLRHLRDKYYATFGSIL